MPLVMRINHAPFQEVILPRSASRLAADLPLLFPTAFLGCAADAMAVLHTLIVAVIGCGSVGGRIAMLLARMGFGGLLLVDPKRYKPRSLATHEIGPNEVGQAKAMAVGRRCKAGNPTALVLAFAGPVEALDLAALAGVHLVVMAPDLLSVEMELGQRCIWLSKPLVQASVHGSTLTVQIRFFLNAKGDGACPVCCYGRDEWELMTRQVRFSCEGATSAAGTPPAESVATNSPSALCSLAADLAVIQILRFLLRLGQPVADTMLEYNGFTHSTVLTAMAPNAHCKLEHSSLAQALVDVPLAGLSLAQVAQRATGAPMAPDAVFELPNLDWIEFVGCSCVQSTPLRKFGPRGSTDQGVCPKCSARFVPLGFYTHRTVSAQVLGSAVELPLHKLGARRVGSVLLRSGDAGVLIRQQPSTP